MSDFTSNNENADNNLRPIYPDLNSIVQVICPECHTSTVVNTKINKHPYCSYCGRAFKIPKGEKKTDDWHKKFIG